MELTAEQVAQVAPYVGTLGARVTLMTREEVRAELDWAPELTTMGGGLHGGALMALADIAGAVCAVLHLPEGASTSTIESTTHFVRAVRSGRAEAVSRPLHAGRSTIVVETDVLDADGRLCTRTTQVQAVLTAP